MPIQLFLNELSCAADCHLEVALEHLARFVATLRSVGEVSDKYVLNAPFPLAEISFGASWPWAVLRNTGRRVEEHVYLKTVVDRFPHAQTIAELEGEPPEEWDHRLRADASIFAGAEAASLGLAHRYGGVALSLASHRFWESDHVELDETRLAHGGRFASQVVMARNASAGRNVAVHRGALLAALRPQVEDGRRLWAGRAELLPNLMFITRTRAQIEGLRNGEPFFEAVLGILVDLDAAVGHWRVAKTPHPTYPFAQSPESRTRLPLTAFKDADGVERRFSEHAKFTPDEGRVHFILETDPHRHALIGHVGQKLGVGKK